MSGKQLNTEAPVGIKIDFVVFKVFFFLSFYICQAPFSLRRDLCIRFDLETALVSGHPAPFWRVTFPCAPRGCSWCQEGPPAGSSCGSLPEDQLTSIRAAEIRCEIEYWILIAHTQREDRGKEIKRSPCPVFQSCACVTLTLVRFIGQISPFVVQIGKQTVVWVEKPPDILFSCLFGLVRTEAKHSSAHTAVQADMESLTTNLRVEEIP